MAYINKIQVEDTSYNIVDTTLWDSFSEERDYQIGDVVIYLEDGLLYSFTANHDAGPWDASQVQVVNNQRISGLNKMCVIDYDTEAEEMWQTIDVALDSGKLVFVNDPYGGMMLAFCGLIIDSTTRSAVYYFSSVTLDSDALPRCSILRVTSTRKSYSYLSLALGDHQHNPYTVTYDENTKTLALPAAVLCDN